MSAFILRGYFGTLGVGLLVLLPSLSNYCETAFVMIYILDLGDNYL